MSEWMNKQITEFEAKEKYNLPSEEAMAFVESKLNAAKELVLKYAGNEAELTDLNEVIYSEHCRVDEDAYDSCEFIYNKITAKMPEDQYNEIAKALYDELLQNNLENYVTVATYEGGTVADISVTFYVNCPVK